MNPKNVLGKFSYFFVVASIISGIALASQIPATASASTGWTANRIVKDVVTGISFAAGGVAGGATIPAVTVVTGSSTAGWAAGGVAGGTAGGAVKQAGDYAVDHPAKAAAKTAPIVAVLYAPIVPGVGFALTAMGVAKSLAKWFKK